jgi:hypothetical protein
MSPQPRHDCQRTAVREQHRRVLQPPERGRRGGDQRVTADEPVGVSKFLRG